MVGSVGPICAGGRYVGAFRGWIALWDALRLATAVGTLVVVAVMVRFEINRARRQYFPMSRSGMWCVSLCLGFVAFTEMARIGYELAPIRLVVGGLGVVFGLRYALLLNRMPSVRPGPWSPKDPWTERGSLPIGVALVGLGLSYVLAQTTTSTPNNAGLPVPWNYVVQWGPLGVGAFALAADLLVPARRVKKIESERDDAVAYSRDVETKAREEILPLLRDVQRDLRDGQQVNAEATKALADFRAWWTYGRGQAGGPPG